VIVSVDNFGNDMADHTKAREYDALRLMYEVTHDQDTFADRRRKPLCKLAMNSKLGSARMC
jgi:hypothetical protein